MAFDVGQALFNIILVGLLQIRDKSCHVGSQYGCRRRHIVIESINVADEQEKSGIYPTLLTHVDNRAVTESQRDAQSRQQREQRRMGGYQITQATVAREKP